MGFLSGEMFFDLDTELYWPDDLALFPKDNFETLWEVSRTPTLEASFLVLVLFGVIGLVVPWVLEVAY